jgi:hypothetical protein
VPLTFNNNLYQCILYHGSCQNLTESALLTVDELTSVTQITGQKKDFLISPVPFNDEINVQFSMTDNGHASIRAMDGMGKIMNEITMPDQVKGLHHILFDTSEWNPGVYFIQLTLTLANEKSNQIIKIIKHT